MIAAGRLVVGTTLLVLPGRAGERWLGSVTRDRRVKVVVRATAARDFAIGAGTLHALSTGAPVRGWTLAGAAGDLTDAAATALALRQIGARRALPVMAVALAAGLVSLAAADHVD